MSPLYIACFFFSSFLFLLELEKGLHLYAMWRLYNPQPDLFRCYLSLPLLCPGNIKHHSGTKHNT